MRVPLLYRPSGRAANRNRFQSCHVVGCTLSLAVLLLGWSYGVPAEDNQLTNQRTRRTGRPQSEAQAAQAAVVFVLQHRSWNSGVDLKDVKR